MRKPVIVLTTAALSELADDRFAIARDTTCDRERLRAENWPQMAAKTKVSLLFPCLAGNSGTAWIATDWDRNHL